MDALSSTTDNRQPVPATFKAFYDFVASAGETFRLVFESDLSNEPAVRVRLDKAMSDCADMAAGPPPKTPGSTTSRPTCSATALIGMAQVSVRYRLNTAGNPEGRRQQLIARLGLARHQRLAKAAERPGIEPAESSCSEESRGSQDRNPVCAA